LKLSSGIKFLIAGVTNTLLTYAIFIALILFAETWIAFTFAYAIGLVWTVFMSSKWVFGSRTVPKEILKFGVMHLILFLIGQAVIWFAASQGIQDELLVSTLIIALTAPLAYFAGKFVFTGNQR
jgi:putative flippase GtrA